MVRRQLPAEQLPNNHVHVHPVAASLAAARATAVAAAVAAAVGLAVAAAAQAFAASSSPPPVAPPPPPPHTPPGAVVREGWAQPRYAQVKDEAYCGNRICFGSSCNCRKAWRRTRLTAWQSAPPPSTRTRTAGMASAMAATTSTATAAGRPRPSLRLRVYDGGAQEFLRATRLRLVQLILRTPNRLPASQPTARVPVSAAGVGWDITRAASSAVRGVRTHRRRIRPTLTTTATGSYARSACAGKGGYLPSRRDPVAPCAPTSDAARARRLHRAALKTAVDGLPGSESTHGSISGWDVSRVDDLSNVFLSKTTFNEPLNWDTSR